MKKIYEKIGELTLQKKNCNNNAEEQFNNAKLQRANFLSILSPL